MFSSAKLLMQSGSGSVAPPDDPLWNQTAALLHMATNTADSKGHLVTVVGAPYYLATNPLFADNEGALTFPNADHSLRIAVDAGFVMPGDMEIEVSMFMPSLPSNYADILGNYIGGGLDEWVMEVSNLGHFSVYTAGGSGASLVASGPGAIVAGAWNRLSYSRLAGTVYLRVNGNAVASKAVSGDLGSATREIYVGGRSANTGTYHTLSMRELRITNGSVRHAGNYTPDTVRFPG